MFEQILNNYCMGFITARETADKLLGAGFPKELKGCLNKSIYENMERILVELESFNPIVEEVKEILDMTNYDQEISIKKIVVDGVLVQEFKVRLFASWTTKESATFEFDNYCASDNVENLKAFKKFVEEN